MKRIPTREASPHACGHRGIRARRPFPRARARIARAQRRGDRPRPDGLRGVRGDTRSPRRRGGLRPGDPRGGGHRQGEVLLGDDLRRQHQLRLRPRRPRPLRRRDGHRAHLRAAARGDLPRRGYRDDLHRRVGDRAVPCGHPRRRRRGAVGPCCRQDAGAGSAAISRRPAAYRDRRGRQGRVLPGRAVAEAAPHHARRDTRRQVRAPSPRAA